jgi:hypothetical protein
MTNRFLRIATAWPALAATFLLAACAAPYVLTRDVDARYGLSVGDGVRLAARAMQAAGYFPTDQNDAAGRVVGERNDKDSFGTDVLTLYIEAVVTRSPTGGLNVNATCSVSQNIVYTDQLDDECEKFRGALDKLLAERSAAPAAVRTPPQPRPAPLSPPLPVQPPAVPARGRDYSL